MDKIKKLLVIFLAVLAVVSCKKDDEEVSQDDIDDQIIQDYLAENDIDAVKDGTGMYYKIIKEGSGGHPTISQTVLVEYKGYLTDGTVFDNPSSSVALTLSQLIYGFQVGISKIQPGGEAIFFIPSGMGYGEQQVGDIPPNSVLIFDVTLIEYY